MNRDIILRAIGGIDEELIERAEPNKKVIHIDVKRRSNVKWLRFAAAVAAAACIALIFVTFSDIIKKSDGSPNGVAITVPAAPENITIKVLGAQAVQAGNWIYYANPADNYSLYKIEQNTGSITQLSDDRNIRIIDIKEGWIYYTCGMDEAMDFVRIRTDGSDRAMLYRSNSTYVNGFSVEIIDGYIYVIDDCIYRARISDTTFMPLNTRMNTGEYTLINGYAIVDGWVYYVEKDGVTEDAKLYKVKVDGTGQTFLCDAEAFSSWDFIGVYEGRIIMSEGQKLFRISPDGKDKEAIYTFNDVYGGHIIFELTDGYAYFKEVSEDADETLRDELYRLNINTGEKTFITDDADEILIDGEWVYYASWAEDVSGGTVRTPTSALYRIKTDGTNPQKLANGKCHSLYPVDDELYYTKDKVFYKINKDGTGEAEVAILNRLLLGSGE